MAPLVYITNIDSDYLAQIHAGLQFTRAELQITQDSKIFIKPNLTFPTYQPGVMTSPAAVEAAILALRDYTSHIYIGDSDSGGYNRFSMDAVYQETGIAGFAQKYGVRVVNLSHEPRRPIHFQYKHKEFTLELPVLLTDEIDRLISIPVPKVHTNSYVSLSYKNLWGCIPENRDRLRLHPYLEHVVLEVAQACRASMAIVDGTYGLNRNGPLRGMPVRLDWLLVADSLGAGDRVAAEVMQVSIENIPHLSYAKAQGFIPGMDQIQLNQNPDSFKKEKFFLCREWTDLPGVLAYNSPLFAYLGYFSPLAGILHKILYFFRKPFYDYDRYVIKQ